MKTLFEFLAKHGLTPNELLVMYGLKNGTENLPVINTRTELWHLQQAQWVTCENKLTAKARTLLKEAESLEPNPIVIEKPAKKSLVEQMEAYRALFPTGLNSAKKPYRTAVKELEKGFDWFFENYPRYNWDQVLAATQYYISQSELKYTRTARYFIKKQDSTDRTFISDLATYCGMLEDNPSMLDEQITVQANFVQVM